MRGVIYDAIILIYHINNMTTLSIPIPSYLEEFIQRQIKSGNGANKADVVRKALIKLREEEAINDVLEAMQELKDGKGLKGDLHELAKKFRND